MSSNELEIFEIGGSGIRFGTTEDGTPYAVASDFAKALGYSKTQNATDLLDDDEAGHAETVRRSANGVEQRRTVKVVYETGMWRLIFRSNLPGAKALTKRVTEILAEIRRTGSYNATPPEPLSEIEIARQYLAAVEEKVRLAAIVAAQAPKVAEHDAFMEAGSEADYPIRAVAKSIGMGPNKILPAMRMLDLAYNQTRSHDSGWHLMQKCIDDGWGQERLTRWENGRGQSWVIYLTARGVSKLFRALHEAGHDVYWPKDILGEQA